MNEFVLSVDLISMLLDALFGGEDYFPHACLHEGFAISIGLPPPDKAIISYLHQGLSQALVFIFLFVSLWTHLPVVCVCGKDMACTLCLISSRLCCCLMLILILVFSKCFAMTHTHHFR